MSLSTKNNVSINNINTNINSNIAKSKLPLAQKLNTMGDFAYGDSMLGSGLDKSSINSSLNKFQNELDTETLKSKYEHLAGNKNKNLSDTQRADFAKVARGFESMFINMIFKGLKSAMLEEKKGDSFGADTLEGYTDMAFSDQLAKEGNGLGIADMIYQNFTGEKLGGIKQLTPEQYNRFIQNLKPNIKPINKVEGAESQETTKINENKNINQSNELNVNSTKSTKLEDRLENYSDFIRQASFRYGVDEKLIKSVISAESYGKADAVSPVGAKGLMQLMDGTAKDLGVKNSFNPFENILGGTKYLKQMIDKYDGDLDLVLSAYNAGPGNVEKYNGVPPFKETQNYINKVKHYMNQFGNNDLNSLDKFDVEKMKIKNQNLNLEDLLN